MLLPKVILGHFYIAFGNTSTVGHLDLDNKTIKDFISEMTMLQNLLVKGHQVFTSVSCHLSSHHHE